eukprot:UN20709
MSPVLYVRLQNTNRGSGLQLKTSDSLLSRCAAPGSQEYTFRRLRVKFPDFAFFSWYESSNSKRKLLYCFLFDKDK